MTGSLQTIEGIQAMPDAAVLVLFDRIAAEVAGRPEAVYEAARLIKALVRENGPHHDHCERHNALLSAMISAARRRGAMV